MIVVAIIAILAAVAIPGLLRSRIGANEASALGSLKSIVAGQECFKIANAVDLNADGQGEYGFLQEISGANQCRTDNAGTCNGGNFGPSPFVPRMLGNVNANNQGLKAGYLFIVYLPATANSSTALYPSPVDIPEATSSYMAYAFPESGGRSGTRVFCAHFTGSIFSWPNSNNTYSTPTNFPAYDALLGDNDGKVGVDWNDGPDVGGPGQTGVAGQVWASPGG